MERACWATNSHLVDDLVNIIVNAEGYSVLIIPGRNNEHVHEQIKTDFRQPHSENKYTTGQLGVKLKSSTRKVSCVSNLRPPPGFETEKFKLPERQ